MVRLGRFLGRLLAHGLTPGWRWRRYRLKQAAAAIGRAVAASERQHGGELCVVIERTLPLAKVWDGVSAHQRALELFALQRVWDTEHNSGVLIYICLADRELHVVADRGINRRVPPSAWADVVAAMRQAFLEGEFEAGCLLGIRQVTALLAAHVPVADGTNELPDGPRVL